LVSNCICVCGHHMNHSVASHSQVVSSSNLLDKTEIQGWSPRTMRGALLLAFFRINQPMLSHMPRTLPGEYHAHSRLDFDRDTAAPAKPACIFQRCCER
jgi:hypothetical protein